MDWTPDLSWVTPDLAIGAAFPEGEARRLVADHQVGAVIDVRVECCDSAEELHRCGLAFLHLPTEDECGVSQPMLDEGVAFARDAATAGRRLLIHCQHGIGRSATVALCVLVDRGMDPLEAVGLAKDTRWKVSPSEAQFEAWTGWVRRRAPWARVPSYHEFGCIAYRHLATQG